MKRSKKPLPEVEIISYGQYTRWDRESKDLPDLVSLTESVEAELDVEFGMIIEIWQAKGRFIQFRIDHPPFTDNEGNIDPITYLEETPSVYDLLVMLEIFPSKSQARKNWKKETVLNGYDEIKNIGKYKKSIYYWVPIKEK